MNFDQLNIGDALPSLSVPITARQIVAGAIASQDFEDVHHEKAAANAKGTPDIFMNILTTNGLVGRFPGDTMTFSAEVAALEGANATIDFIGKNSLGNHVTGTAYLCNRGKK